MWMRYFGSVVGFAIGGLLAWVIGFEYRAVSAAGIAVAAVVMTFGERWGLVPAAEDVKQYQTLFGPPERDRPAPRDTPSYLSSIDMMDDLKNPVWEKVASATFNKHRNQTDSPAQVQPNERVSEASCAKCSQQFSANDDVCPHCKTSRQHVHHP